MAFESAGCRLFFGGRIRRDAAELAERDFALLDVINRDAVHLRLRDLTLKVGAEAGKVGLGKAGEGSLHTLPEYPIGINREATPDWTTYPPIGS